MPQLFRSNTASPTVGSPSRTIQGPNNPTPRNVALRWNEERPTLSSATRKPSLLSQEQTIDDTDGPAGETGKDDDDLQESIITSGNSTEDEREEDPLQLNSTKPSKSNKKKGHNTFEGETVVREMEELAKVYSSVVQKLKEMNETIESIAQIRHETLNILNYQKEVEERDVKEITQQLEMIEDFRKELGTIEGLKGRVGLQSQKVQICQDRLRNVQVKMDNVKQNEIMWKQRQSRRLRVLWGIALTLLVLWFLLAMPGRSEEHEAVQEPQEAREIQEVHQGPLSFVSTRDVEATPMLAWT